MKPLCFISFLCLIRFWTFSTVTGSVCDSDWQCYVNGITNRILLTKPETGSSIARWLQLSMGVMNHFSNLCTTVEGAPWLRNQTVYMEAYSSMPCKVTCLEVTRASLENQDSVSWILQAGIQTTSNSIWNVTLLYMTGANCAFYMVVPYNYFRFQAKGWVIAPPEAYICNNVRPKIFIIQSNFGELQIYISDFKSPYVRFCFRQLILQRDDLETRPGVIRQLFTGQLDSIPSMVKEEQENTRLIWNYQTDVGRYVSVVFSNSKGEQHNLLDFQARNAILLKRNISENISKTHLVSRTFKMSVIIIYKRSEMITFNMSHSIIAMCFSALYPGCCNEISVSDDTTSYINYTTSQSPYCMLKMVSVSADATVRLTVTSIVMKDIDIAWQCSGGIGVLFHTQTPPVATLCRTFLPGHPHYWENDRPFVIHSILSVLLLVVYVNEEYGSVAITAEVQPSSCRGIINPTNVGWQLEQGHMTFRKDELKSVGLDLVYSNHSVKPHWWKLFVGTPVLEVNILRNMCVSLHILPHQEKDNYHLTDHLFLFTRGQSLHKRIKINVAILGNKTDFELKHAVSYGGIMYPIGKVMPLDNRYKWAKYHPYLYVQYNATDLWMSEQQDIGGSHGVDLTIPAEYLRLQYDGRQVHSVEARAALEMRLEGSTGDCDEVTSHGTFTPYIGQCGRVNFVPQSTQTTSFTLGAFNPDLPRMLDPVCCIYKVTFRSETGARCVNGLRSLVIKEITKPPKQGFESTVTYMWKVYMSNRLTWYSTIREWTYQRVFIETVQRNNTEMCPLRVLAAMFQSPRHSRHIYPCSRDKCFHSVQEEVHKFRPFSWLDAKDWCDRNEMEMVSIRDGDDWGTLVNLFVRLYHRRITNGAFKDMYNPTFRNPNIVFIGLAKQNTEVSSFQLYTDVSSI